jgi:hypothetical protein
MYENLPIFYPISLLLLYLSYTNNMFTNNLMNTNSLKRMLKNKSSLHSRLKPFNEELPPTESKKIKENFNEYVKQRKAIFDTVLFNIR